MRSGAHRLALQQLDARAAVLPDWPTAVVKSLTTGSDGVLRVTVDYLGAELTLPHMEHYTPVVGHVVVLIRANGLWTILGRPVGFPAT